MTAATVGIDVAKEKLDIALYQDERYQAGTFSNDKEGHRQLLKWLKKQKVKGCRVCLEATGRYGDEVVRTLYERGYAVSVVNPARIKAYGESQLKRNKSDRDDARVIAHFCATQEPALWTPPPPEIEELQALTRRVEALVADRTREENRKQSGVKSAAVLADIDAHIAFLNAQIAELRRRIDDLIDRHPDLRRQRELLVSIPGVGAVTAAKFIAEVPDISRFDSAGQLAAYLGLTPRNHDSGSSVHRRPRLSKAGNSHARAGLFMPALVAISHNPLVQDLVRRLEEAGKKRMTIVGAAMRKLVHLMYGVLKNDMPFDPHYLENRPVLA